MSLDGSSIGHGQNVSRETSDLLVELIHLLTKWNKTINLVGKNTTAEVWSRHILDSVQLAPLCPPDTKKWLDMGSGGGMPALVVAVLARESSPHLKFILMESDRRKAEFLRTAVRSLGLNAEVRAERIEKADPCGADVISARALAPLPTLIAFADRHGTNQTICLFPKGRTVDGEIQSAMKEWTFNMTRVRSRTDPQATILIIKDIARA